MKKILKSIVIAFSIYSKIPVPQFEWKEEDMKYMLCFFPWVGIVVGIVVYAWCQMVTIFEIGDLCRTLIAVAIPLIITGGFHVDGFMDTCDAFYSYQSKEKKLQILKDSHIGAFAVIMLVLYGLLYVGAFSEIKDNRLVAIVCAGYVLARALSGISVVSFGTAKKDGLVYLFASHAHRKVVKAVLYAQAIICICLMIVIAFWKGLLVAIVAILILGYYYLRCKKELGGITGDTAGYFVLICELGMTIITAVLSFL